MSARATDHMRRSVFVELEPVTEGACGLVQRKDRLVW